MKLNSYIVVFFLTLDLLPISGHIITYAYVWSYVANYSAKSKSDTKSMVSVPEPVFYELALLFIMSANCSHCLYRWHCLALDIFLIIFDIESHQIATELYCISKSSNIISVVDFQRWWVLKSKIFAMW